MPLPQTNPLADALGDAATAIKSCPIRPAPLYVPVAFLSHTLARLEKEDWPTEMETLGLVWAFQKANHWIEASRIRPICVFTDHRSILGMQRQVDIVNTTAASASNLKLVRAVQFLSLSIRRLSSTQTWPTPYRH